MNDNTDNDNADKINRCADAAAGKLPLLIINQVCKEIKAVGNAILPDENDHPTVSIVFNIDCMEYMKNIPDKHFDLAIVDPPYGIGKDWKKRNKGAVFADTTYANSQPPTKEYFDELKRISKHYIIWGWNYYADILGNTNYLIVWDKMSANNKVFHYSQCEIACTDIHIPCKIVHIVWDGYRMGKEHGHKKIHPHQKPIELYEWLLDNYAKPGYTIFDSHLGSGSSRIAAYKKGFSFFGCEIDPTYYKAADSRFMDFVKKYNHEQNIYTMDAAHVESSHRV